MATALYYFSATGNSLYAAKRLQSLIADAELYSIPEMLRSGEILTTADKVGFIFPQHYYGLPMLVEDSARKLAMPNVSYLFAVVTCGLPYIGRPFSDFDEILRKKICIWMPVGICGWFPTIFCIVIPQPTGVFVFGIAWRKSA